MDRAWVVVANGSRARFFRAEKSNGELVELAGMEAPEVRAHETKLTTDLPGETFDSHGQGRHAYSTGEELKKEAMRRFAKDVAARINRAAQEDRFERLYLASSPTMLGMLREYLEPAAEEKLRELYHKDWTLLKPHELRARLPEHL